MHDLRTKNGYRLDELVSWLQKAIRRGLEEEALFVALEMGESGYGQYLLRRLQIIAAEDVGLADPMAMVLTTCASLATKDCTKSFSQGMATEMVGLIVLYLCRAPKNREGDDAIQWVMARRRQGWKPAIPDVALDQHTEGGRKMGRGAEWWWTEGSKLNKPVEILGNIYRQKLLALQPEGLRKKVAHEG